MRTHRIIKIAPAIAALVALVGATGCAKAWKATEKLNPYQESGPDLGERNTRAILGETSGTNQADRARHALEVMATYRDTQAPQPTYPVIQPAEVRLMWVPDHVNKNGDLVPSHYYYLKVLHDRWAVQDAFELEQQLDQGSSGAGSATPWVYK